MIAPILGYTEANGLVFCENLAGVQNDAERLYISEIQDLDAYAVFFRRFYKDDEEKPYHSEPAVCIFSSEKVPFNGKKHEKLHAALWSEGKCEIYIIQSKTRVDVFNARRPAEIQKADEILVANLENLRLASSEREGKELRSFSAFKFGNGTFWEQPEFSDLLNEKDSPHIHLLNYLMAVRKKFLSRGNLQLKASTIDKLLVVSILVKFLEEIKDPGDDFHTLQEIYAENNVSSFISAVQTGRILNIFEALGQEFNGEIFDKFNNEEKEAITNTDLGLLADFLSAKIDLDTKQLFFWEQYSFRHLPPEVISSIYENFIQAEAQRNKGKKEKGVVYTPIHLVNFLVDESMPINKAQEYFEDESFKVLDPACGSGVFLVAAFKRLLQWWAINNSKEGKVRYPNSEVAQKILQRNIFGVDVKETAALVSIFSLTTALLDKLTPKEIWSNLKLKDLSKQNVQGEDFFKWAKEQSESFDLVIGNPPFNPETGVDKYDVLDPEILDNLNFKHRNIPRANLALYFFEGGMSLADRICMIIPSAILLYNNAKNAQAYRKKIFTNYSIRDIYDFTHLRRDLFHTSADIPVLAVIADNKPSNKQPVNHTVIKRMVTSDKKVRFEIDYYDKHRVPWKWAVDPDKQFIWKTNLLGGGRLFQFIYRLSLLRTLKEYIAQYNGWKEDRGFEGGKKYSFEDVDRVLEIKQNGKPVIKSGANFTSERLKDEFMYTPPFILIDQILGEDVLPCSFFSSQASSSKNKKYYYNRDFVGISAPANDEEQLIEVYKNLRRTDPKLNYQLYLLSTSSSSLVLTETDINKSEILNIPYPKNELHLRISKSERIIQSDVLDYYRHFGKSINEGSAGSVLSKKVTRSQLEEYGKTLCNALNEIYSIEGKSWQLGNIYLSSLFTICQIGFGKNGKLKKKKLENLDEFAESLIKEHQKDSGAVYKRVARIYTHFDGFDCIYLIKPNTYRYWLRSIALRDADDTFKDLKNEGY